MMAKRARLGKGLGALFPDLPGEDRNAEEDQDVLAANSNESRTSKTKVSAKKTSSTEKKKESGSGVKTEQLSEDDRVEQNDSVESDKNVSRETNSNKLKNSRVSVPKLSDLKQPSDLFFEGTDDGVSRETLQSDDKLNVDSESVTNTSKVQPAKGADSLEETVTSEQTNNDIELKPVQGGYMAELSVSDICPNSEQPRKTFDEDELVELSHSIAEVGLLQPIVVRKLSEARSNSEGNLAHYEIIMGERRWRATTMAGLDKIPAIVKTTADNEMLRDALLENLHRVALNPLEEAAAYQQMMEEFGMTQEGLSKSVSKSRPQIANTLRLLKLPAVVQKRVESGVLSAGHARALLSLSTQDEMEALADKIISEGLSVRSTEELVALKTNLRSKKPHKSKSSIWTDSPVLGNLENHFETKVDIKGSKKKGRIEITYSSPEDMDRIISLLLSDNAYNNNLRKDGWV